MSVYYCQTYNSNTLRTHVHTSYKREFMGMIALTPTYTIIWYDNIVSIYIFFICFHFHRNATRA